MTRTFTGVLAVLHRVTPDGRQLDEPHPELTRPTPLFLQRPGDYTDAGVITHVWRDGDLIRYSGQLDDEHPEAEKIAADIQAGRLVGMLDVGMLGADQAETQLWYQGQMVPEDALDAVPIDAEPGDVVMVLHGWRVVAATLMPPEGKTWPEVSLTLEPDPRSST